MDRLENITITPDALEQYSAEFSRLGSEYFFSRFSNVRPLTEMSVAPTRMSGVMIAIVTSGSVTIEVNLSTYHQIGRAHV